MGVFVITKNINLRIFKYFNKQIAISSIIRGKGKEIKGISEKLNETVENLKEDEDIERAVW